MIILAAVVFGALTGWGVAKRRGGRRPDLLHYAAVYGIAFGIAGVFVTVVISRLI